MKSLRGDLRSASCAGSGDPRTTEDPRRKGHRVHHTYPHLWFQVVIWFCGFDTTSLLAQDRILLQQAGGSRIPVMGHVEDYTGRELILRLRPEEPIRRYPRADVIEVSTEYTPHHDRGRKLFAAGKIAEAKKEFATAFDEEDRPWVRREILADQVRCDLWGNDCRDAIHHFLRIADSDPETFHYRLVPLNWTDDEPPANVRFDAKEWISLTSPPLKKLIGASWLLSVPDLTVESEQILKRLARDADVRIQRLAQMQLWRLKLKRPEQLDPVEIAHWEQFVDGIPTEVRGGAHFVIGQAWKQRKEHERAARAFLWLPLVYDADRWLSGRACFEAAESLEALGDTVQSANLYSEVVFRYGDTRYGAKAEAAWKALRQAPQGR